MEGTFGAVLTSIAELLQIAGGAGAVPACLPVIGWGTGIRNLGFAGRLCFHVFLLLWETDFVSGSCRVLQNRPPKTVCHTVIASTFRWLRRAGPGGWN